MPKSPPQMIVIFPDEELAFDAYRFLQINGISPENMVLVGKGFSSPEYLGCLMPPYRIARQTAIGGMGSGLRIGSLLALLAMGLVLYLRLLPWWWAIGLGVSLLCGATLVGGILGWLFGWLHRSHISAKCRSYLNQGQYILLLEGSEAVIRRGREILHSYGSRYDF
ncbi:MAG: hypothetical protein RMK91_10090 [Pseudanabaenaceae cyanobacterium SKYGB_i_bin29]|nr:hypothetical protein [Pseudanabaenaceae cyanobacterium SKYG29]MDW8422202.1 hypothetical protein [Pseudanabaenaceae cyanobacterium SKYGB_i_bin29]